ncbi:hypothetical protein [Staphylococcus shinii]|uniref:hypothetical protein n=1 Tax=Staphylococcus shinii TaxID=2912228 RepID=UPI00298F0D8D|nr:hypothetical protein [Staphylococcus shinii]MDW8564717.1 hypothetical protein [Staphylococcus shinii]
MRQKYMHNLNNAAKYVGGLGGLNSSNPNKESQLTAEKIGANAKATANIIDSTNALNFNYYGISTKSGKGGIALNTDGLFYETSQAEGEPVLIADENGINTDAIPKATTSNDGLMSSEDKKKLNNITDNSITINGIDGKKYKITVDKGQIKATEV